MSACIGLDLDNTLIRYDQAFLTVALERNLLSPRKYESKREVRDAVVAQHTDLAWQALQGFVYGRGIDHASLYPGVLQFLAQAREAKHRLVIISHKTQYGHFDETRTDLRDAARGFLEAAGVFEYVDPNDLHFCPTRGEKLAMIAAQDCRIFIDDLEDILTDPQFPQATNRLHFAVDGYGEEPTLTHLTTWAEIARTVFDQTYAQR